MISGGAKRGGRSRSPGHRVERWSVSTTKSRKIERLDATDRGLSEKVEQFAHDFAYIKKAWWAALILLGIAFNEAYDTIIRPMIE